MIDIKKNASEVVRVERTVYNGHSLLNVRIWFKDGDVLKPSKKGLTVRTEMAADLIKAMQHVLQEEAAA